MSTVIRYAAPTPQIRTPSNHACPVISGSVPTVREKTYAAATDTANCAASSRVTGDFTEIAYHG